LICRIGNVFLNVKIPQNETVIYGSRTYDNCNSSYDIMHHCQEQHTRRLQSHAGYDWLQVIQIKTTILLKPALYRGFFSYFCGPGLTGFDSVDLCK